MEFLILKIDLVISHNQICEGGGGSGTPAEAFLWQSSFHRLRILHILSYHKIYLCFQKIEFVISKNQGYFVI